MQTLRECNALCMIFPNECRTPPPPPPLPHKRAHKPYSTRRVAWPGRCIAYAGHIMYWRVQRHKSRRVASAPVSRCACVCVSYIILYYRHRRCRRSIPNDMCIQSCAHRTSTTTHSGFASKVGVQTKTVCTHVTRHMHQFCLGFFVFKCIPRLEKIGRVENLKDCQPIELYACTHTHTNMHARICTVMFMCALTGVSLFE